MPFVQQKLYFFVCSFAFVNLFCLLKNNYTNFELIFYLRSSCEHILVSAQFNTYFCVNFKLKFNNCMSEILLDLKNNMSALKVDTNREFFISRN